MHKKKKHKRLRQLIRLAEEELQNISTLPYYTIFNRETEQQADILQLQTKISNLKLRINK
jgi:hypothetical protein